MLIPIEPVTIWPSEGVALDIYNVGVLLGESAIVNYYIRDADNHVLVASQLAMTPEQYAEWGSSDEYVSDLVLTELGLAAA